MLEESAQFGTTTAGADPEQLGLGIAEMVDGGDGDNITDECLRLFQARYGPHLDKDAIWEYLYGIMHAPDWREAYRFDLQRNLPRIPPAAEFEPFRAAGRELMDLHINYETGVEHPDVICEVDGEPDSGGHADPEVYRIGKLRWATRLDDNGKRAADRAVLIVNDRVRLVGIPPAASGYTVSGRSPLDWAIASLRHKKDKPSGIADDPNRWHAWADAPFELVRHLRRLAHIGCRSAEIVASLPPSLGADPWPQRGDSAP